LTGLPLVMAAPLVNCLGALAAIPVLLALLLGSVALSLVGAIGAGLTLTCGAAACAGAAGAATGAGVDFGARAVALASRRNR
jgi:hypothetical protein